MARVEVGRAYRVAAFGGRPAGGRRVGGYMPRGGHTWKRIHELNMPVLSMSAVGRLLTWPGLTARGAYEAAGLFWRLASEAANSPVPGVFVEQFDGRLWAVDDAGMARMCGLSLREWQELVELLLPRSGVGALELTTVTIEVDDEAPYRKRDGQMELFGRQPGNEATRQPDPELRAPSPETRLEDELLDSGGRVAAGNEGGRSNAVPLPPPSRSVTKESDESCGALMSCVAAGDEEQARMTWVQAAEAILRNGGTSTAQDRRDWGRLFSAIWTRLSDSGQPPSAKLRQLRFAGALEEARTIVSQDGVLNPVAVFNTWARKTGWRGKGSA